MLKTKIKNFNKMLDAFKLKSAMDFYNLKYIKGEDDSVHYLTLKNGLKLGVNKNAGDLTTLFEIFVNDDYPFKGDANKEFNVLDIGANVGYFSLYISQKYPKANIFSFEPFPNTFKRLSENVNMNSAAKIKPFQFAVSDFHGTADFYSFDWAGCNTLIDGNFDEGLHQKTTVNCISFEEIFEHTGANEFAFGKIDCEGSEYPIFLNSKDESIRRVKNYIMEVHNDKKYTKADLIKRFESLGYTVNDRVHLLEASLNN
jgi:FkbM family methyltransferase